MMQPAQQNNAMPPGAPVASGIGGGVPMAPQGALGAAGMGGAPPLPAPQGQPNVVTIDAVMRLLRDNAHRRFRIDIETGSTISGDQSQEKQDRSQFIEAITKLVETWGPIITARPELTKLAGELMLFGVRGFDVGRSLEEVIEETVEKMEQAAGVPKPPPQPSPDDLIKLKGIQVKTQAEIQKAQIGVQQAQIDAQAREREVQLEAARGAQEHAHAIVQGQQQAGLADQQARNEAASQQMKAQVEEMRFRRAVDAENAPDKPVKG
jgi:hypothetical protein